MRIIRDATPNWEKLDFHQKNQIIQDDGNEISKWQIDSTPTWGKYNEVKKYKIVSSNYSVYIDKANDYIESKFNIEREFETNEVIIINFASESIVVLDEKESNIFHKLKDREFNKDYLGVLNNLIKLGIFVKKDVDENFKFLAIRSQSAFQDNDIKNITILPTQSCNARCFYCFSKEQKHITMTDEIIQDTIEFIKKTVKKEDKLSLRWFGGEPLIVINIIDKIYDGILEHFGEDFEYFANVTTNCSMLTEDLITKFKNKWKIRKVHLTLDGIGLVHNMRKNYLKKDFDGFTKVMESIDLLLKNNIYVSCRLNLDKNNFSQFTELLDILQPLANNEFFFVHVTTLHQPEFGEAADYFNYDDLEEFSRTVFSEMLNRGFYKDVLDIVPRRAFSRCLACMNDSVIIGADGYLYKCTQKDNVVEEAIGNCKTGIEYNNNYSKWMDPALWKSECDKCRYLPICQGGCRYYRSFENDNISACSRMMYYMPFLIDKIYEMAR